MEGYNQRWKEATHDNYSCQCDALESSIQLFKEAYKALTYKVCPLPNEEGLGTEFFCCHMASFKASNFS
jgi:hypothetical protein